MSASLFEHRERTKPLKKKRKKGQKWQGWWHRWNGKGAAKKKKKTARASNKTTKEEIPQRTSAWGKPETPTSKSKLQGEETENAQIDTRCAAPDAGLDEATGELAKRLRFTAPEIRAATAPANAAPRRPNQTGPASSPGSRGPEPPSPQAGKRSARLQNENPRALGARPPRNRGIRRDRTEARRGGGRARGTGPEISGKSERGPARWPGLLFPPRAVKRERGEARSSWESRWTGKPKHKSQGHPAETAEYQGNPQQNRRETPREATNHHPTRPKSKPTESGASEALVVRDRWAKRGETEVKIGGRCSASPAVIGQLQHRSEGRIRERGK